MKLEERSRDLAEENLKKEITNCLKLLEVRTLTFGNYRFVILLIKFSNKGILLSIQTEMQV